jgi:hypothetical protein
MLAARPAGAQSGVPASAPLDAPLLLVNTPYPPFVNTPGHPRGEGIDIEIARLALQRGYDFLGHKRRGLVRLKKKRKCNTPILSTKRIHNERCIGRRHFTEVRK